jgi:tetratricopeptide (TPR) repeat protein
MLESAPGTGPVLTLITGPGGVGKSTLVAQAVARYGGRYRAALTLSCVGYQGMDLFLQRMGGFLQRQGVPRFLEETLPNPKLSMTAKIEAVIEAFNQAGPCLLVVDNLESVQQEDHTLTDADLLFLLQKLLTNLRSGRVLITGRYAVERLLPDGKFAAHLLRLDLDDLSYQETQQLFECHPPLARLSDVVRAELAQAFGGLPYLYDLLSSKAARQNLEGLIHDAQGRITFEHERRAAAEWQQVRQQVIEFAALEATVARLPEQARTLLARLSVFRRPFPQEALEQGVGAPQIDWQPLVDWALLRYDLEEKQYRLHSLTAHYAEGLLDASGRQMTQVQLAEWYVHAANTNSHDLADYLEAHYLFRAAGEIQRAGALANTLAETLDRLGLYQLWQNLCAATIRDTQGQLAAEALRQLGIIAESQGKYDEAQHLFQEALAAFDRLNDQPGRALTLHQLTNIAHDQGRYEEMNRMCHQLLALYRQQGDTRGLARTLYQLGTTAQFQGDYEKAQSLCEECLAIFEQLGDQNGRATVLGLLGLIAQFRGDYEQARGFSSGALAIFEQRDNQDGRADTLHLLGLIAQSSGDYEQALRLYRESLAIKERLGKIRGRADTLGQLGIIASLQGKYDEARRWYGEALRFYEQMGHLRGKAIVVHQLGILTQRQGQYEEAQRLLEESLALKKQIGDQRELAATLHQLGSVAEDQGKYEQAMGWYNESLTLKKQLGDRDGCARTLGQLGNMAERRGDYENAVQLYEESSMLFDQLGNQAGRSGVLHALGNIAYLQGEDEKAEGFYRESLALSEQLGHQRECALTLAQLGLLAEKEEDYHAALAYMAQALIIFRSLQVPERQTMLDQITKLRVTLGEDTFTTLWQEVTEGQALLDLSTLDDHQLLLQSLMAFLQAPTPAEGLYLIEKCPDLLTVEADALLEKLVTQQQDEDMRHIIEHRRKLLTRCREEGIAAAFAELKNYQPP